MTTMLRQLCCMGQYYPRGEVSSKLLPDLTRAEQSLTLSHRLFLKSYQRTNRTPLLSVFS